MNNDILTVDSISNLHFFSENMFIRKIEVQKTVHSYKACVKLPLWYLMRKVHV
jgi:hypothetical protein